MNDSDKWIAEETAFIRSALLAGMPMIGVCLGSQFMAKALGATVRSGKALEIGMTPVRLTDAGKQDPVFGAGPESFAVFEWHGEVFDLPKDCVPLAGSDIAPLQAFRLWRSCLWPSLSFGNGGRRDRLALSRMCAGFDESSPYRTANQDQPLYHSSRSSIKRLIG